MHRLSYWLFSALLVIVVLFAVFALSSRGGAGGVEEGCSVLRLGEHPLEILRALHKIELRIEVAAPGEEPRVVSLSCTASKEEGLPAIYKCVATGYGGTMSVEYRVSPEEAVAVVTSSSGRRVYRGLNATIVVRAVLGQFLSPLRIYICRGEEVGKYIEKELLETRDTQMRYEVTYGTTQEFGTPLSYIHISFDIATVDVRPVDKGEITLIEIEPGVWLTTQYTVKDLAGRTISIKITTIH